MTFNTLKEYKELIFCFIFIIFIFASTVGVMLYNYYTDEEHMVYVEYTIYTPSGTIKKSGTYKMRGDDFISSKQSYRGSNTMYIKRKDSWFGECGNQSICLYVGTSDVEVNKIIVK